MTRLPSEGIIDVATGLIGDVTTLLVAAVAALVVWFIVKAVWSSGGAIGATVMATDLRASASLVIAGLVGALALLFAFTKMPEVGREEEQMAGSVSIGG